MDTKILTKNDIITATEILHRGGLVAVPTETVYGLAANGLNAEAVERIYAIKGRPENKPLSLMVSGAEAIDKLCVKVPQAAYTLAEIFFPGPLTIVLEAKPEIPEIVRAGGKTVGLRCPDHPLTLELLRAVKLPLAAPSANPSDKKSPTEAGQVRDYFDGKIEGILDGGVCNLGTESTIIDLSQTPYKILRQGAVSEAEINMALMSGLKIIGITGGTGCGKTTALETIKNMGGIVLDCDEIYHDLLKNCKPLRCKINEVFPNALPEGSDDTKALGEIVFKDAEALKILNSITHHYVGNTITDRLSDWAKNGGQLAAIDAIALIEGGIANYCIATVGITAPTVERIKRLILRENITDEYAKLRISAQKSNEYFMEMCDYTIENDSTTQIFAEKCKNLFKQFLN